MLIGQMMQSKQIHNKQMQNLEIFPLQNDIFDINRLTENPF